MVTKYETKSLTVMNDVLDSFDVFLHEVTYIGWGNFFSLVIAKGGWEFQKFMLKIGF